MHTMIVTELCVHEISALMEDAHKHKRMIRRNLPELNRFLHGFARSTAAAVTPDEHLYQHTMDPTQKDAVQLACEVRQFVSAAPIPEAHAMVWGKLAHTIISAARMN